MKRTMLRNKYLKVKSDSNATAYKRQRNKCVALLRKAKKSYYGQLKPSDICDNKKFWKTVKPLFNDQRVTSEMIISHS